MVVQEQIKNMKILIDIDDTISNFGEVLLNYLNRTYETNYKKEDIINWEWFRNNFENPWQPTEWNFFWDDVKIDKKAIECIENLSKNNHEVYLVSASFPNDCLGYKIRKTLNCFDSNLINESNIIICKNKEIIKGNIRIDDGYHNLYNDSLNILFDQPWNQNINSILPTFERKKSWEEIEVYLENIFKEYGSFIF